MVLENQVKAIDLRRQKEESLDWFRDRADREAERQAEREEVERERQAQADATRERELWAEQWVEYALDEIPRDAPTEIRLDVHQVTVESLSALQPWHADNIVRRLVDAAVERGLRPWRRRKEIQKAIEQAVYKLPLDIRNRPEFRECKQFAIQCAEAVIAKLPLDASYYDLEAAAITGMQPTIKGYAHLQACERVVSSIWLSVGSEESTTAKEAVRQALALLPVGVAQAQLEKARDAALVPFRSRIAERERATEKRQREERARFAAEWRVDRVLSEHIEAYLEREWEYSDDYGGRAERREDAETIRKAIRKAIREPLITGLICSPEIGEEDLRRRIERFASDALVN